MKRERDKRLWKYDISTERYRYLNYFCKQYAEWKAHTSSYGLNAINNDGMPHASGTSNPTERQALANQKYLSNILLIESTCKDADESIWKCLLLNVAYGITYEYLNVPCGRRQFYESRRRFFYILDLKMP